MPSTMQNIAGVQEITQTLIGLDAAEKQERTRLVSRNVVFDTCTTKYPMRDYVDSPGNAGVQFFESGLHSRSGNNHPVCFPPEPFHALPSPPALANTPPLLNMSVYPHH